jgi:photosystem II stability/assembly factor-like uncharacterized protein
MKKFRNLNSIFAAVLATVVFHSAALCVPLDEADLSAAAESFGDWQVVGPTGGDVRAIVVDPKDKDRLYISTLDGQIHTSANGGKSWRLLVNLNQPELILDQLLVDERDSRIIYTSGHRHKQPGGFFRSTDGGATWKEAKELRQESIHAMTQSDKDPGVILVGTTNGVWRSTDSGENWKKVESTSMPVNVDSLAMDPRNTDTMYAGTWWRAYKSTDAGKNWNLIKEGMIDDSDVFAITVNSQNPEHVIASACSGIYESFNGGAKWAKIQGIPSQSRRTRDLVQHPSIPGTVYAATTEGFWMTTNGGKTWALTTQRNLEINSIAVHKDEPNRIFIGTNNYGVMVSNDGGKNFVPTNENFTSRFTYSVTPDVADSNRLYAATHNIATGGGFLFMSNDAGRTWRQARNLDVNRITPYAIKQDKADPNLMYLGTNIGLYRSIDRGETWTYLAPPPPPKKKVPVRKAPAKKGPSKTAVKKTPPVPAKEISAKLDPSARAVIPALTERVKVIEILAEGRGLLVGTDNGLYQSADPSKGWVKLPFGPGISENVFVIHVPVASPRSIWVGTASSGVILSRDEGKTWERAGGAIDNIPVSSIKTDPKRPEMVYVGTVQTFYVSKDGGRSWNRRGGNLPLGNYNSILINPDNSNEILLASSLESDGGIYISNDSGNRWKRVDTKDMRLPSRRVWALAYDPQDSQRIFAGTHSSGVYRIERTSRTSAGM